MSSSQEAANSQIPVQETSNQMSSNLEQLKSELKPKLCLNAKRIDKASVVKILNSEFLSELIELVLIKIDDDDAGLNV